MGTLASFLFSAAGPLVIKALLALGIGTLTFTGVTAALQALIQAAQTNWSSIPADVMALASLAGVPQGLGIIAGAFTSRVGMWAAASATKWITK